MSGHVLTTLVGISGIILAVLFTWFANRKADEEHRVRMRDLDDTIEFLKQLGRKN